MDDKIIATYCLCDELLKAIRHQEPHQGQMNDAEVMTTAFTAALFFRGNHESARAMLKHFRTDFSASIMASATWPTCRHKNGVTRGFMPKLKAMLHQADVTGRAPEARRKKVREASGLFLHGLLRQCSDPRSGLYGQFAGILQGEIRQRMSRVRILMIVACEGTIRSRFVRDP